MYVTRLEKIDHLQVLIAALKMKRKVKLGYWELSVFIKIDSLIL